MKVREPVLFRTLPLSRSPRIANHKTLPLNISKTLHAAFAHWKLSALPSDTDLAPDSEVFFMPLFNRKLPPVCW